MKKIVFILLALIAISTLIVFCSNSPTKIPVIGRVVTELNLQGKWMMLGYKLTEKSCAIIETTFKFDQPEKGMVQISSDKESISISRYIQDDLNNRLIINKSNYMYVPYSNNIYLLVEFPVNDNGILYNYYEVYFFIKAEYYNKEIQKEADAFFVMFFTGEHKGVK